MMVNIRVTGGDYEGAEYPGELAVAPVTALVPEGIVSARTIEAATRVRESLREMLTDHRRSVIGAVNWQITATRVEPA